MKVIVPVNNKGGVGKTKVTSLIAEYFSYVKKTKTLAIDLDPQCNLSNRYLKMEHNPNAPQGKRPPIHPDFDINAQDEDNKWDGRSSIANIFLGEPVTPYPTFIKDLDIAPGHAEHLGIAEDIRKAEVAEKVHYQLHRFLSHPDIQKEYEVVVIDTPPSKNCLTISAMKAATHIIIPSSMEPQPIEGIFGMMQLWMQESLVREKERPVCLIGILPNLFRQNVSIHKDYLEGLKQNSSLQNYIFPTILHLRAAFVRVDASNASPRTIYDEPPSELAKIESLEMCKYVEKRVFSDE